MGFQGFGRSFLQQGSKSWVSVKTVRRQHPEPTKLISWPYKDLVENCQEGALTRDPPSLSSVSRGNLKGK